MSDMKNVFIQFQISASSVELINAAYQPRLSVNIPTVGILVNFGGDRSATIQRELLPVSLL